MYRTCYPNYPGGANTFENLYNNNNRYFLTNNFIGLNNYFQNPEINKPGINRAYSLRGTCQVPHLLNNNTNHAMKGPRNLRQVKFNDAVKVVEVQSYKRYNKIDDKDIETQIDYLGKNNYKNNLTKDYVKCNECILV